MQIIVCQIFFNLLYNISPGKQGFHFSGNVASGIINKRSDDRIITRIFPVTCRLCLRIILQIVQIIQHIPWAVNIIIPKMITIIPFSDRRCILCRIRIQQKFLGFFLGKPKIFTEPKRENTVRHKIIGSGKNTLLRHFQTSGDHCKLYRWIIFQR